MRAAWIVLLGSATDLHPTLEGNYQLEFTQSHMGIETGTLHSWTLKFATGRF